MGQTLKAVFDDRGAAQHALYKLLAAGFTRAEAALSLAADPPSGTRHVLTLTAESPNDADRATRLVRCLIPADVTLTAEHYGTEMHNSEKYRNRSWDEVDRELKRGWEQRYHGAARWDESQAAIRRGWTGAAPEIDEDAYYRTHWNAQYAHAPRRIPGTGRRGSSRQIQGQLPEPHASLDSGRGGPQGKLGIPPRAGTAALGEIQGCRAARLGPDHPGRR